jgi:hypothetical protein
VKKVFVSALFFCAVAIPTPADELLFTCGNHNPSDTATTLEQAEALTREKGCRDWHISSVSGKAIEREKFEKMLAALNKAYNEWAAKKVRAH